MVKKSSCGLCQESETHMQAEPKAIRVKRRGRPTMASQTLDLALPAVPLVLSEPRL